MKQLIGSHISHTTMQHSHWSTGQMQETPRLAALDGLQVVNTVVQPEVLCCHRSRLFHGGGVVGTDQTTRHHQDAVCCLAVRQSVVIARCVSKLVPAHVPACNDEIIKRVLL